MNRSVIVALSLVAILGCRRYSVKSDFDQSTDFTAFKSFSFATPRPRAKDADPMLYNDANRNSVVRAITRELSDRGYHEASPSDLVITVDFRVKREEQVYVYDELGYSPQAPPLWNTYTVEYKIGTLVVNLFLGESKKLVWQGVAVGSLPARITHPDEKIQKVVGSIFEEYPVGKVK